MAKSDRKLTLEEVLNGNISEEYIDKKERKAIIGRHIGKLAEQRFDIEDKMSVVGKSEELLNKYQKLTEKILKLQNELKQIESN